MILEWIGDAILLLVVLPVVVYLLRGVLNAAESMNDPEASTQPCTTWSRANKIRLSSRCSSSPVRSSPVRRSNRAMSAM